MSVFQARFVKPSTLKIGDVIKVTWHESDVEHSIIGTVWSRDHAYQLVNYKTAAGTHLVTEYADGTRSPTSCRITLLQPAPQPHTQLDLGGL